ncbi:hypothetical protein [Cysteiniphilum litorale]|uniref:hypothetical protein n=1 Tax=Cysteiniphilum litorale TaxID=2056700 RepID=UPI003F8847AC
MEHIKIHIKLTDRMTSITVHETLFNLLSIKLTGTIDDKKSKSTITHFLSDHIVERMGNSVPKRDKNYRYSSKITKYANDIIISEIADKTLLDQYNQIIDQTII